MKGAQIAAFAVLVALCGVIRADDSPAAAPGGASSELVKAGAVWDAPEAPFVVSLAKDGTISALGLELGLDELTVTLRAKARAPRLRNADGTSAIDLVLRVAPSLPWTLVQWVMQACADPGVQISRIYFAVTPEGGGVDGVMPAFLPKDRSVASADPEAGAPMVHAVVLPSKGKADPGAVYAALKSALDATADKTVTIETPPPRIPRAGAVLELVDLCYRAGAEWIQFGGASRPRPGALSTDVAPDGSPTGDAGSLSWLRAFVVEQGKTMLPGMKVRVGETVIEGTTGAAPSPPPLPAPPPRRARVPADREAPNVRREPELAKPPTEPDPGLSEPATPAPGGPAGPASGPFSAPGARRLLRTSVAVDPAADAAVEAALRWLAAHQSADGRWSAEGFDRWCDGKPVAARAGGAAVGAGKATYDVGISGLAVLAFLGAGHTDRSEGPYGKVLERALTYLRNVQDGEGCYGPRASAHYAYGHAIATLAMVEAFGMTRADACRRSAAKALDFIAVARNPYFAWRYGVKPGDNDTSVTGWMADALHQARLVNAADATAGRAPALPIDEEAFEGVRAWIDKMTDPDTGRVGYQMRGTGPARPVELVDRFPAERSESMTAIGVCLRLDLGEDPATSDALKRGVSLLAALPPVWNATDGSIDLYYWEAGARATWRVGGPTAQAWRSAVSKALTASQRTEGEPCGLEGSWDPIDPWGADGGRVYMTAMAALALEAPYRESGPSAPGK